MTTIKAAMGSSEPRHECCMCGDYGLSYELFQCKICQFRSQHRYCSNLYPKAESYRVCNWCLSPEDTRDKSQNSSNSSTSHRSNGEDDCKNKRKTSAGDNHVGIRAQRGLLQLQVNGSVKKQRSPEGFPSSQKRAILNGGSEEKLRRTRSEEVLNGSGIAKQVFRNKVRRYKLLDEVSS